MMKPLHLFLSVIAIVAAVESCSAADPSVGRAFFDTHCVDCHGEDTQEGRFRADTLGGQFDTPESAVRWSRVIARLEAGEMPPQGNPRPPAAEIQKLLLSAKQHLAEAARETRSGGRVRIRRLNRLEYENTLRDLLQIDTALQDLLPEDDLADGFSNNTEALSISPVHIHQYMAAADRALQDATVRQERPETKTHRFPYSDEAENPFHGHAHNKLLCNLRGENLYFFGPTHIEVPAYLRQFVALTKQTPGRYRIRVTTEARDTTDKEDLIYSVWLAAGGKRRKLLGYFDAHYQKPTSIELTRHFERNQTIIVAPYRMSKVRIDGGYSIYLPDKQENVPKGWHHINNPNPPIPSVGPALVVKPVEITGPIIESWPPPGHRLLYGDAPLVPAAEAAKAAKVPASISRPVRGYTVLSDPVTVQPAQDDLAKVAKAQLSSFISRAFRRPVSAEEVDVYFSLANAKLEKGECFEVALNAAHRAVLCSPDFLFLVQDKPVLDDFELASRLSYFLWRSSPDAKLRGLAEKEQLSKPDVLRRETNRLIASSRFEALVNDFLDHWLNLREINATTPDRDLFPEYFTSYHSGTQDGLLHDSIVKETRAFVRDLIDRDLGVEQLVSSHDSFLNQRLAEHYDLPPIKGAQLRRVTLPAESVRGGLLTQASILKVTANGANTSPVIRGVWLLERILGTPVPPPPPNAGSIEPDTRGATTIREQLAKHKNDESCAICHRNIDPPGFALEAFDPIGRYRDFYRTTETGEKLDDQRVFFGSHYGHVKYLQGAAVDASSTLPDDTAVSDIREFKTHLATKPELIARSFVSKLVTFATGKNIEPGDLLEVDLIVSRAKDRQYGMQSLIHEVVQSELFRNK
jgi:mono/diheme cytochrome c family protein